MLGPETGPELNNVMEAVKNARTAKATERVPELGPETFFNVAMLAQSSADMTNYNAQLYGEVVFPCESDDATECEPTRDDISDSSTKDTLSQSRDDISDSSMTDTLSQSSDDISDSSRKDTLSQSSDDISDSSMKDTVPQSEACKRQKQADPASLFTHGSICEGETG